MFIKFNFSFLPQLPLWSKFSEFLFLVWKVPCSHLHTRLFICPEVVSISTNVQLFNRGRNQGNWKTLLLPNPYLSRSSYLKSPISYSWLLVSLIGVRSLCDFNPFNWSIIISFPFNAILSFNVHALKATISNNTKLNFSFFIAYF